MYVLISPFGCESTQGSLPVSFGVSWERGQFDAGKERLHYPFSSTFALMQQANMFLCGWVCSKSIQNSFFSDIVCCGVHTWIEKRREKGREIERQRP